MRRCISTYVPHDKRLTVVDFGSRTSRRRSKQQMLHRSLLSSHDCELVGVDVVDGPNVDVVMKKPYRLPMKSNSVDLVLSGQVFEHVPFFWASMLEIARVLKPDGLFLMTVPSRGHPHTAVDCWRYYPDGLYAMAAFAGLEIQYAHTDFPPRDEGPRHRYSLIDDVDHYWGDTVGVFRKPRKYPSRRIALARGPLLWWANQAAGSFISSGQARAKRRAGRTRAALPHS
jgi:SAM-dependent methyltransferase